MLREAIGRGVLGAVIVSVLLLPGTQAARAEGARLVLTQDESSMERVIEAYLKTAHDMVVTEKQDKDDLILKLPMKGDPMPGFTISIDTQHLNADDAKKVIERGVLFELTTTITVPQERRSAVLEVLNDVNRRKAFCTVYIDSDGEVVLSWILNVMSDGLDPEYVFDVVARIDKLWRGMFPDVAKALEPVDNRVRE